MGLRCLLGHDYSEPRTEGERDDRGGEVVVTIREYQECARCGDRRVLSENKEITADDADGDQPVADPDPAPDVESPPHPGANGHDQHDNLSAEDDDGVILEDDSDRGYGEWPARDQPDDATDDHVHAEWPTHDGPDEGFAAEPTDGQPTDIEFTRGSLTPERPTPGTDPDPESESPDSTGEPVLESTPEPNPSASDQFRSPGTPQRTIPDVDLVFKCPACGNTASVVDSSLRAGDICPACHDGYLTETAP